MARSICEHTMMEIGEKIRMRREISGISAKELAIRADITAASLSRIEGGQVIQKIDTLIRIAEGLEVSLSQLQPTSLDQYDEVPKEFVPLITKVKKKTPLQQKKLLQMYEAMAAII